MANIHFITFANSSFMNTDRIIKQAKSFEIFDTIFSYNETHISEFIEKHYEFIKNNKRGFGSYIWKPKIIYDKLSKINNNDILVYCDAGIHLNINGKPRFLEYLEMLNSKDIITFLTSKTYIANTYVKNDAVMEYYPEFQNENRQYMYAGIMIIRKTVNTLTMIQDWLRLCENYRFLDNSPSIKYIDIPGYQGQDCDNGLFALCVYKYEKNVKFIDPIEFNVYDTRGYQIHNNTDWSSLENYPFQCRRDRPRITAPVTQIIQINNIIKKIRI